MALAVMVLHFSLFAHARITSIPFPISIQFLMMSNCFSLCLPLALVPLIMPVRICNSDPSFLTICPINCSCCFLMADSKTLFVPIWVSTSSLLVCVVQLIRNILRYVHISKLLIIFSTSFVIVHVSHPYLQIDHT